MVKNLPGKRLVELLKKSDLVEDRLVQLSWLEPAVEHKIHPRRRPDYPGELGESLLFNTGRLNIDPQLAVVQVQQLSSVHFPNIP